MYYYDLNWGNTPSRNLILPTTRKKVAFLFFVVESLSNPGNSMSITKLSGKIGFEIFPDFEVPWKKLKNKLNKLNLPTFLLFWPKQSLFTIFKTLVLKNIPHIRLKQIECYD